MNFAPALNIWTHAFYDSALGSQQTFRAILEAMENPGRLVTVHGNPNVPEVFNSALAATCLTLLDCETPVWTDINSKSRAH